MTSIREDFHRGPALGTEPRCLPAALYNLAHTLLARSGEACLFVPIRSMQYLAVMDAEEIIFVDGQHRREVVVAWRHFKPQARASLGDPVAYEAVYHQMEDRETLKRLQGEFARAVELMAGRQPSVEAQVVPFRK